MLTFNIFKACKDSIFFDMYGIFSKKKRGCAIKAHPPFNYSFKYSLSLLTIFI